MCGSPDLVFDIAGKGYTTWWFPAGGAVLFAISVIPGFNPNRSHGGPVAAGLHVRIGYLKNTILRLEICR
jgi:hypothetical protein